MSVWVLVMPEFLNDTIRIVSLWFFGDVRTPVTPKLL